MEVVICDTNREYAKRLIAFLRKQDNGLIVRYAGDVEILLKEVTTVDCLIIDENLYEANAATLKSKLTALRMIILSERKQEYYSQGHYYKYESASKLMKAICEQPEQSSASEVDSLIIDRKIRIKNEVLKRLPRRSSESEEEIYRIIDDCLMREQRQHPFRVGEQEMLRRELFHAIRGLDVIQELLEDEEITEIMVNGYDRIFIEKGGRLYDSGRSFDSRERLLEIIRKIVAEANRTINLTSPIVDARLKDGSRVNAVLDPVAINGPILTIRRFGEIPITAERLVEMGSVTEECLQMLKQLVRAGYNILISGGTGAGKTTFLNIMSSFIPHDERIITIEDSAELQLHGIENLVRLEARMATPDGVQEISIRSLIKTALRSRPDRVIVGEVRSEEAIDMLQAFNIGEDGSMSTIHANSAVDALYRLETIVMLHSEIPLTALRRQIASGIDIVVHIGRLRDKSRHVLEIVEVLGVDGGELQTHPIFRFEELGEDELKVKGMLKQCGKLQHIDKLKRAGLAYEL